MKLRVIDRVRMIVHEPENRWGLRMLKIGTGVFAFAALLNAAVLVGIPFPWKTGGQQITELRFIGATGWTLLFWTASRPPTWSITTVHNPPGGARR